MIGTMVKRYTATKAAEKQKQASVSKVEIYDEQGYTVQVIVHPSSLEFCSICHRPCEQVQVWIRGRVFCYWDVPENFSFGVAASTDYLQQGDR